MAGVEIKISSEDSRSVASWRAKLLKLFEELSPATDAAMIGKRYAVTLSEKSELERKRER